MSEESLQTNPLFRFVLGTVSEAEQQRIEEECFTDPVRQQELWAVFDEVAERFWQGDLPSAEAQQFAARLHASPLLAERANHLRALLAALAPPPAPPASQAASSFWFGWPTLTWWQGGVAATALLLALLGIIWWQREPTKPELVVRQESPSPAPTAGFSPSPPSPSPSVAPTKSQVTPTTKPPASTATLATFFLLSKTVRDSGNIVPLPVAPLTETLTLQMEVRKPLYPRYRVTVQSSDGVTRTIPNLRPQPHQGGWMLAIQVPVAAVATEPFTVQINGVSSSQESVLAGTHVLQVQKK